MFSATCWLLRFWKVFKKLGGVVPETVSVHLVIVDLHCKSVAHPRLSVFMHKILYPTGLFASRDTPPVSLKRFKSERPFISDLCAGYLGENPAASDRVDPSRTSCQVDGRETTERPRAVQLSVQDADHM